MDTVVYAINAFVPGHWSNKMTKNNLGKSKWDKIIIGAGLYGLYAAKLWWRAGRAGAGAGMENPLSAGHLYTQARVHMSTYPAPTPRRSNPPIISTVLSRIMISAFTVLLIRFTPPATASAGPTGNSLSSSVRPLRFPAKK